jgi:hypothetical protein
VKWEFRNIYKEKSCWYYKMVDKKGQQMTLGTIIAIVLGIAVLVFLIFGFSKGWNNMWDTISEIGGGKVNVDDVVRGCSIACSGENTHAYCSQKRTITLENKKTEVGTCKAFENENKAYGISCSSVKCEGITQVGIDRGEETEEDTTCIKGLKGEWSTTELCVLPKNTLKASDKTTDNSKPVCCSK